MNRCVFNNVSSFDIVNVIFNCCIGFEIGCFNFPPIMLLALIFSIFSSKDVGGL